MAQSTDGSRGKIGFKHGRHAWEVRWEGPLGTVAVVGIATKDAAIQCHGYYALLGKILAVLLYLEDGIGLRLSKSIPASFMTLKFWSLV